MLKTAYKEFFFSVIGFLTFNARIQVYLSMSLANKGYYIMMHLYWIGKGGVAKDFFDKYLNPQPPSTDYIVNMYLTIIS